MTDSMSAQNYDTQHAELNLNASSHSDDRRGTEEGGESGQSGVHDRKDINSEPEAKHNQINGISDSIDTGADDRIPELAGVHNIGGASQHEVKTVATNNIAIGDQEHATNGVGISEGDIGNQSVQTEKQTKDFVSDGPKDSTNSVENQNSDNIKLEDIAEGQDIHDQESKNQDNQDNSKPVEEPIKVQHTEESLSSDNSGKDGNRQNLIDRDSENNTGSDTNVNIPLPDEIVPEPECTSSPRVSAPNTSETSQTPADTLKEQTHNLSEEGVTEVRPSSRASVVSDDDTNLTSDNTEEQQTSIIERGEGIKEEDGGEGVLKQTVTADYQNSEEVKDRDSETKENLFETNDDQSTEKEEHRHKSKSVSFSDDTQVEGEHFTDLKRTDEQEVEDSTLKSSESEDRKEDITPGGGDDTLDDIEALTTISETAPVIIDNQSTPKEEEEVAKVNITKQDVEKSEMADDIARADDMPKVQTENDTDHETDDLVSDEVLAGSENPGAPPQNTQQQEPETDKSPQHAQSSNQQVLASSETTDSNVSGTNESQQVEKLTVHPKEPATEPEWEGTQPEQTNDEHSRGRDTPFELRQDEDETVHEISETEALVPTMEDSSSKAKQELDLSNNQKQGSSENVNKYEQSGQDQKENADLDNSRQEEDYKDDMVKQGTKHSEEIGQEPESSSSADRQQTPDVEDGSPRQSEEQTPEPEPEIEPEPEPEPVKITRNINIDNAVDTVNSVEICVKELLEDMKELMDNYHQKLKSQPLSVFVEDLDKFRGDFKSMQDAYNKCDTMFILLNKSLKELRVCGDEFNSLMDRKFREEELSTWTVEEEDEEKERIKAERIAATKTAIAKATDARAFVAKAAIAVSESNLLAGECEADAADAATTAARAQELAQMARKDVEDAKIAADEKRKSEEIARERAAERARKKAEEEKKKRIEEDKQIAAEARRRGVSFIDEKKRNLTEKARKETERRNPKNWPRVLYSMEGGEFDPGVGCIIRAIDGCLKHDDVDVELMDQMSGILTLVENEELISNIIQISPRDRERNYKFEEPLSLAIPHCIPRAVLGREPVVKTIGPNGKWVELPTKDMIFEDIKELKFAEAETRKFGVFAVVLRLKRDIITFTRKGNKVHAAMDARVSFSCPPGMVKGTITACVEVQPIDQTAVTDLRYRRPAECSNLMACSPIMKFVSIQNKKFNKPLTMTLPLPQNPTRPKRPATAVVQPTKEEKETRPVSARPLVAFNTNKEEEIEEELHLLARDDCGVWTKLPDVNIVQAKNKDIVTMEVKEPHDRLVVLRTGMGVGPPKLEAAASLLETSVSHRSINIYLRQLNTNLSEIMVSACNVNKTEKELRTLCTDGFDEGPPPSPEIAVKEGQIMDITFRGNVHCVTEDVVMKFIYNTYIKSKVFFEVLETDKFAQKGFNCYRGFTQIRTKMMVPKPVPQTEKTKQKQLPPEMMEEERIIAELLISIPKPDPEPPRPLCTAPIKMNTDGPDTKDVLMYLAGELGEEWKKLAMYLNLKSVRIQAILRQNNMNPDPRKVRYDMLVTWAKRIPRSVNKLDILAHALLASGRGDLAEELREREADFRRRRNAALRDTYLNRAFVKVAQNPTAVKEWKTIAKRLGVSDLDVTEIERTKPSIQEKCYHSLRKWQTTVGDQASLPALGAKLRMCNYRGLARDIETIG